VALRYEEIGQRLRAFRLGSGLSADEIALRVGISRTAVYRFEKGEVVKIEALVALSELLGVSLATLLGVEIEYIPTAVTYFERLRQLEEDADRIVVLAGPISLLLSSDEFIESIEETLVESISTEDPKREKRLGDISQIIDILKARKINYHRRQPNIVNLISALDIERLLRSGFTGRPFLSQKDRDKRRARARKEIEHFCSIVDAEPIGTHIGLVTETLPHTSFQIFRRGDVRTVSISPFRLGEQPNISLGIAMITATEEAVSLHEKLVDEMWRSALKGERAAQYLRTMLEATKD
jgi:transcriptional regulator with XRE-family HTH domain